MRRLSLLEQAKLRGLQPHTRAHALHLLEHYPQIRLTSGRRSPAHNRRVGGSPTSWHLQGRAVDLVGPLEELHRAAGWAWADRIGPNCTGPEEVLIERPAQRGQHLHVAW